MHRVKARCSSSRVSTSAFIGTGSNSVLRLVGSGLPEVAFEVTEVDLGQLRVAPVHKHVLAVPAGCSVGIVEASELDRLAVITLS